MLSVREEKSFLIKKAPIVSEFLDSSQALAAFAAARSFVSAPGHVHMGFFRLESDYRKKLEEANLSVLQEAVEYGLKVRGLDYDEDILQARIIFERDRAELLSDLQRETADLRRSRELDSHTLRLVMIELALREAALSFIETNTASQIEALRLEEGQQEQRTHPYSEALAANIVGRAGAKIDFATERLRIIQPIRDLIDAQRAVIEHERDFLMPEMEILIDQKGALIDAQVNDLLPAMDALAAAITLWATERPAVIVEMLGKAQAALDLATSEADLVAPRDLVADAQLAKATELSSLITPLTEVAAQMSEWALGRPALNTAISEKAAQMTTLATHKTARASAALAHAKHEDKILIHLENLAAKRTEKAEEMLELLPLYESLSEEIGEWVEKVPDYIKEIDEKSGKYVTISANDALVTPEKVAAATHQKARAEHLREHLITEKTELLAEKLNEATNIGLRAVAEKELAEAEKELAEEIKKKVPEYQNKGKEAVKKAEAISELAEQLKLEASDREEIAKFRLAAAQFRYDAAVIENDVTVNSDSIASIKDAIEHIRLSLELLRKQNEVDFLDYETDLLDELVKARKEGILEKDTAVSEARAAYSSRIAAELANKLASRKSVAIKTIHEDDKYHTAYGNHRYDEQYKVAEINAIRKITSKLVHQIS